MTISHSVEQGADEKSVLAGVIRGLRKRAGLTQRQTAAIAGCSLASVANLEAGLVPNHSQVAGRIVAALEAEVAALETPAA